MRPRHLLPGLLGGLLAAGCANADTVVQTAASTRPVHTVQVSETFQRGAGPAITYDEGLVPAGARGAVQSRSGEGTTTVMLAVRALEPHRVYGAHVHTQPCGEQPDAAGPHFQYAADPVQPSVDPTFANPQNEIWLDLTTDETGAGSTESTVAWTFPADRRPKSLVLHTHQTSSEPGEAGTAGDRVACVSVDF
ncbi:superoxide dismutase family protein [Pseudonocardia sp. DSM 110487]|uniref:superoxide dismutase family protein n=1 Tax=Pseudonocardia sp. DSM 110487 TaxID=2865833 RepID=UPI001C6A0A2C|nr:superoxide dismutase family protein [Pseudonocardia sp. DSM 110487]QYN36248.1 superoxide dismutase family protein [Pseudonocardia sp. DSM 110487]